MTLNDFMEVVRDTNRRAEDILDTANKEYARDDDKFNNFHVTAMILSNMNPRLKDIRAEDIALIFMLKHLFSVTKGVSLREGMEGRYLDLLNYIHLHHGITLDAQQQTDELHELENARQYAEAAVALSEENTGE